MFSIFKTKFKIEHSGRGRVIAFKYKGKPCTFNIEMIQDGNFIVFTDSDVKFNNVREELRAFLNNENKQGWQIEQ